MNKEEFLLLDVLEQLDYVNKLLLSGQSLTTITKDIGLGRTTIGRYFKKIDYSYDTTTKQYTKSNVPHTDIKDNNTIIDKQKPKEKINKITDQQLESSTNNKLKLNIPLKAHTKVKTKAFNVVMPIILTDKLDRLAKAKGGYSRNEIINIICKWYMDIN